MLVPAEPVTDRGVRLWCLRHAESEANAAIAGAGNDSRLTAPGRDQAVEAARELAAEPIAGFFCSTALRAHQTAEILAMGAGLPVKAMPELVEAEVHADVLRAWVVEQDLERRAADGETGSQVVARMTAAFETIAAAHPGGTVAVVGHVASLTLALGRLCALGTRVWGTPLPHARPFLVEWDSRAWLCRAWPAGEGPRPGLGDSDRSSR